MQVRSILASLLIFGATVAAPGAASADEISPLIFLNNCAGGCTISSGNSNSQANTSPVPRGGTGVYTIPGYSHSQQMWDDFVACMEDVYAPYGAQIVTTEPPPGTLYHEIIIGGSPLDIGLEPNVLGVSATGGGVSCNSVNNAITFVFSAVHPEGAADYMCMTAAQESGHTWGLDHEFDCGSPMTYLNACGRTYFRNANLACGEYAERPCGCSGQTQNSHIRLLDIFGPGTPLPAPVVTLTNPTGTTVNQQFTVSANASAARGLGHSELLFNGYRWESKPGNFHAESGTSVFTAPADLPDGVIDVEIRVYDDLEIGYGSATRTVTKGAPCTSADSCALGQMCDAGKCYWDPPTGAMGDACTYPQACTTGVCEGDICTESCFVGVSGDCPTGYECVDLGGGGSCQPGGGGGGGGGCSTGGDDSPRSMLAVLGLVGLLGLFPHPAPQENEVTQPHRRVPHVLAIAAGLAAFAASTSARADATGGSAPDPADGGAQASDLPHTLAVAPPAWVDPEPAAAEISSIIYLNRCGAAGGPGCMITQSGGMASNSILNQTWLAGDSNGGGPGSGSPGTMYTLPAFPYSDTTWDAIVACVAETYAPYNVTVTDVDPGTTPHHESIVAGDPADLGLPDTVGGVGPLYPGCSLHDNTISFTFATIWPDDPIFICSVVAQETAHGFGLEHTFNCADPLTYLPACGLQYFRNEVIPCGEYAERACSCGGGQQNTHSKMLDVFGPNPTPLPAPVVNMPVPADGATVQPQFTISATGSNKRGMGKAELYLNGYKWDEINAQRGQTQFIFTAPVELPDGVIDIEVRLYNDLETVSGSDTATVTKGAPCTTADSCLTGQHCDAGKCYWDPAAGALGDECAFDQFCTSGLCRADQCTVDCNTGVTGDCPTGYECLGDGGTAGYCIAEGGGGGGGCCSVGDGGLTTGGLLAQLGLACLVLGGMLRPSTARGASRRARSG